MRYILFMKINLFYIKIGFFVLSSFVDTRKVGKNDVVKVHEVFSSAKVVVRNEKFKKL